MSKFKIAPRPAVSADKPASIEEFGASAPMVKSQTGGRPLKPVRLNLDIEPMLHKRLKQRALDEGQPAAALVRAWILERLS